MLNAWQDVPLGSGVAFQVIGDQYPGAILQALEQLAEEALGSLSIAMALHQNIQDMTILIHGPPQVVNLPVDGEVHLIQVPLDPSLRLPTTQGIGVGLAELQAPLTDRLVADHDSP